MTGWMAPISPCQAKVDSVVRSTGSPAKVLYCLGKSPPARVPRPAATITAATDGAITFPGGFLHKRADMAFDLARSCMGANDFHRGSLCCIATLAPIE